jgi:SNF2 family DNA or RNA helicase
MYAKSMSTFSPWQVATWDAHKLHELGMRISHMTHVANKYTDPEISAEFPEEHWEDVIIDMSSSDQKLYQAALDKVLDDLPLEYNSILTKMSVLQMICNNPGIVPKSRGALAQALNQTLTFTDAHCAKLDVLKDMLLNIDGKIVLFSMFNDFGAKMLIPYLVNWGVRFVLYDGSKKQAAEDRFRHDNRVKVFLSSDQGSDSINLEQGTSVINYDLPWNYSTLVQRVNRISRLTSTADHVYYYNLIMADTIEERKLKVLMRKKGYEQAVDKPLDEQTDLLINSSVEELKWILTGS